MLTPNKTRKEKRFLEMIFLGVLALGLLITSYFVFINKDDVAVGNVPQSDAVMSQTEIKLCVILSEIEGVGKINAYVNESEEGEVLGVVLVFEGADNLSVRMDVLEATARALGVAQKNVSIYQMTK